MNKLNINKELIEAKYKDMIANGKKEDFLSPELGNIKIFINNKPAKLLFKFKIGSDEIYVGSN